MTAPSGNSGNTNNSGLPNGPYGGGWTNPSYPSTPYGPAPGSSPYGLSGGPPYGISPYGTSYGGPYSSSRSPYGISPYSSSPYGGSPYRSPILPQIPPPSSSPTIISSGTPALDRDSEKQMVQDVDFAFFTKEDDYSKGPPRHHRNLYFENGDTVIQVQSGIFKIHRHFLIDHSPVLEDMFSIPTPEGEAEQKPIELQDEVEGWEMLLMAFYRPDPLVSIQYTWDQSIAVLRVAHKYCMKRIEERILKRLQVFKSKEGFINLLVASQLVDSRDHYVQAIQGLAPPHILLSQQEAERVGFRAFFDITACRNGQFKP